MTRRGWRRVAPVMALGLLALAGCAQEPGTAAVVGGQKITQSEVNVLTRAQCELIASSPSEGANGQPLSLVRNASLSGLIQSKLALAYAATQHVTYSRPQLRAQMVQVAQQLSPLPAADRVAVTGMIEDIYKGQLELTAIGRKALLAKGQKSPADQDSLNAGQALASAYAAKLKIDVNPEFSPGKNGLPGGGGGSLSVAVSAFAKQSNAASPKPSWGLGLPKNQQCGG